MSFLSQGNAMGSPLKRGLVTFEYPVQRDNSTYIRTWLSRSRKPEAYWPIRLIKSENMFICVLKLSTLAGFLVRYIKFGELRDRHVNFGLRPTYPERMSVYSSPQTVDSLGILVKRPSSIKMRDCMPSWGLVEVVAILLI